MSMLSRRVSALEAPDRTVQACIFKPEAISPQDVLTERNAARVGSGAPPLSVSEVAFVTFRGL